MYEVEEHVDERQHAEQAEHGDEGARVRAGPFVASEEVRGAVGVQRPAGARHAHERRQPHARLHCDRPFEDGCVCVCAVGVVQEEGGGAANGAQAERAHGQVEEVVGEPVDDVMGVGHELEAERAVGLLLAHVHAEQADEERAHGRRDEGQLGRRQQVEALDVFGEMRCAVLSPTNAIAECGLIVRGGGNRRVVCAYSLARQ